MSIRSIVFLEEYIRRINRSIERNKVKIDDYESKKETLSEDGHWSLGYLVGTNSSLENTLDELTPLLEHLKSEGEINE